MIPLDYPLNSTLLKLSASPCKICRLLSVIECPNDEPKHQLVARRYRPHEFIYFYRSAAQLAMETAFQEYYYPKGGMRDSKRR